MKIISTFLLCSVLCLAQNRTKFAGIYNAVEYAYGTGGSVAQPLRVGIGNAVAGAQTISLVTGVTTLSDGTNITPIATTTPITIGNGADAETVTPSAVVCPTPLVTNSCQITATFARLHFAGDRVASGTIGLQEALNAAAVKHGSVVVDGSWNAAGGTSGMISAATIPTGTAIADNRAGAVFGAAGGGFTAGGDLSGTTTSQNVIRVNGASVPPSQPCLGSNSGSQIIAGTCGGTITSPGTSINVGGTTSAPTIDINTVFTNGLYPQLAATSTYGAGAKQVFQPSATVSGIRLVGAANPSVPVAGDLNMTLAGKLEWWNGSGWLTGIASDSANLTVFPGVLQGPASSGDLVINTGDGIRAFRSVQSTAWVDSSTTTFFQIGPVSSGAMFTASAGNVLPRAGLSSTRYQLSNCSYTLFPVPTDYFELDIGTSCAKVFSVDTTGLTKLTAISIASGSNKKMGSGTLTGGTATISNTSVTANSKIFIQDTTSGSLANVGVLTRGTITAGTGFVVNSTNVLDTSTFDYLIVENP